MLTYRAAPETPGIPPGRRWEGGWGGALECSWKSQSLIYKLNSVNPAWVSHFHPGQSVPPLPPTFFSALFVNLMLLIFPLPNNNTPLNDKCFWLLTGSPIWRCFKQSNHALTWPLSPCCSPSGCRGSGHNPMMSNKTNVSKSVSQAVVRGLQPGYRKYHSHLSSMKNII